MNRLLKIVNQMIQSQSLHELNRNLSFSCKNRAIWFDIENPL